MCGRRIQPGVVIARATNPEGRVVELDASAWDHVVSRHPEMAGLIPEVMNAISTPEFREPDVRPGRERFFLRVRGSGWIRVVTAFHGSKDRVVTAFLQRSAPGPLRRIR